MRRVRCNSRASDFMSEQQLETCQDKFEGNYSAEAVAFASLDAVKRRNSQFLESILPYLAKEGANTAEALAPLFYNATKNDFWDIADVLLAAGNYYPLLTPRV